MKWTACVSCCLAAGLGGVALLIAPSPSTAGPQISGVPAGPVRAKPVAGGRTAPRSVPKQMQDDGGIAGAGGAACSYQNLVVGPAVPVGQKDPDGAFYAEAADDFVLTDPDDPDGLNGCLLDEVTFAIQSANNVPPDQGWSGVKITIYQDRGNVCLGQVLDNPCSVIPDKGPGGYPVPVADGTRQHMPCCPMPDKEAIVCELKVPLNNVTVTPLTAIDYEITVSGLAQFNCVLEKNKKYWCAPAAEVSQTVDVVRLITSPVLIDHEAQFVDITGQVGPPFWSPVSGPDLYLAISADKLPPPIVACQYENLRVGQESWGAQKATDFPFYAETADDFVLVDPDDPDGQNPCLLDSVTFAVDHSAAGIDPSFWEGVKITIYQDRGVVCANQSLDPPCERNPEKGPGGYPVATTDPDLREHQPCCLDPTKEAIVCQLKVPMSKVTWVPIPNHPLEDVYEINVFGLDQYNCELQKNKKYWIAPAPVMQFSAFGQTFALTSPNPSDHEAQLIFPEAGLEAWSQIQTQVGSVDPDLYLAVSATKVPPPQPPCQYENLRLSNQVEPAFVVNSQKHYDSTFFPPFYAEAADDFVLTDPDDPNGTNPCRLDEVVFAVQHEFPTVSPADWDGVKITVYQDRGNVCQGQPQAAQCLINSDKGPGGYPLATDNPDTRDHDPCCLDPTKEAIVCELKVPMSQVAWVPLAAPFENSYEITVFGLRDMFVCNLQKNKKYWLAPAPVMNVFDSAGNLQGGTYLYTSPNEIDHEAQVISEPFGFFEWLRLGTQIPFPETDLYLGISANKVPSCPWDCADFDGQVGIGEFLAVLARWGPAPGNPCDFDGDNVIGINEFLKVLAQWGACP